MATQELIIDYFAGGGGASEGIERALGRPVDIAVNHDPAAIEMHRANHPRTGHLTEDVFRADIKKVTRGRKVGLAWFSPDCKHFSRAKGGKPVDKTIRGLAWVAIKCAAEVGPRVLVLENVREFQDWGPLCPQWACACGWKGTQGQAKLVRRKPACPRCDSPAITNTGREVPDPAKKGITFKQFVGRLKALGYHVEWKVLNAADYGAPTHRRRLFLVARDDGKTIHWPDPTHGDPVKIGPDLFSEPLKPWRTAAECIDWSIPCPSIFDRKKPLAEKTLKRIAHGIKRYVLDCARPYLVDMTHENRSRGTDEPMGTVTTQGNRFNVVSPVVAPLTHAGDRRTHPTGEPLPTVTGANRGELGLVAPLVARLGQTGGNGKYANGADEPVTTITSKAEHMLIAPVVANLAHGEAKDGRARGLRAGVVSDPLGTVHAGGGSFALIAPTLVQTGYGEREGQAPRTLDLGAPLGTVVGDGQKHALCAAFVAKHFGGMVGVPADTPLPTTTARGTQNQLAVANLVHLRNHTRPTGCDQPLYTITAGGTHVALVYSFLVRYFGTAIGQHLTEPLFTITGKDRFGLVTVLIAGEPYVIVDIGMRMLKPRELATAQGFRASYVLTGTATNQVERIGNSVCPDVAEAIVRANCADLAWGLAA